jgi:hypothetical protein
LLIVVVGEPGVTIVAVTGPAVCVHRPVPAVGVLPAIVAVPAETQTVVMFGPAFAVVGNWFTVTVRQLLLAEEGPSELVVTLL